MRWAISDVEAVLERRKKWERMGTVRTHKIDGTREKVKEPPKPRAVVAGALKMSERQVVKACMNALTLHRKVAFAWRQNVGAMRLQERRIRFAFRGCSDILGCMADGRFLAIECKATGKKPTLSQEAFLEKVRASGGVAFWVDDAGKMVAVLEAM